MEISKEMPDEVKEAALNWLNLIDSKNYSQAYSLAAPYFKEKVNESDWLNAIKSVHLSHSPNSSRKLLGSKYFTSLPGAPDGEYFVIQFCSQSHEKIETIETITPVLDNDQWKICGYYIK